MTFRASWPPASAEDYVVFDVASQSAILAGVLAAFYSAYAAQLNITYGCSPLSELADSLAAIIGAR